MAAYYTYNFLPPVSSDFDSLLHDFEQESNHTYTSFASVWRKHKLEFLFKYFFSLISINPNYLFDI
jgi:Small nuclear RNA activating complex (SNAPc), subunit 1